MTTRHLERIKQTLYPALQATTQPHSILELVNVHYSFPARFDHLRGALDKYSDGCILHIISGSAYFSTRVLAEGEDERIKGVIIDSVPQKRVERNLLRLVGVPQPLLGPCSALTRALLVSPLFGATLEYTDRYSEIIRTPATYGKAKVLLAHSTEDDVVPIEQFRDFARDLEGRKKEGLTVYTGVGKHAAMARDDEGYAKAVKEFVRSCEGFAPEA
jgi:hypothetical protein